MAKLVEVLKPAIEGANEYEIYVPLSATGQPEQSKGLCECS